MTAITNETLTFWHGELLYQVLETKVGREEDRQWHDEKMFQASLLEQVK